jgi:hypothetical protein
MAGRFIRTGGGVVGGGAVGRVGAGGVVGGGAVERVGNVGEAFDIRRNPDVFINPDVPPVVKPVVVADNSQFIDRVNLAQLADVLRRPTKTLVVSQSPPAGDQVPAGTPITLTLTVKQVIPLGSLGVDQALATKFTTVGALEDHIDADANAAALRGVLTKGTAYQDLSAGDKGVADGFLNSVGGIADADRAKAFDDLGFAFNL